MSWLPPQLVEGICDDPVSLVLAFSSWVTLARNVKFSACEQRVQQFDSQPTTDLITFLT